MKLPQNPKPGKLILTTIALALCMSLSGLSSAPAKKEVKAAVKSLIAACKAGNFPEVTGMMAYTGSNKKLKYKSILNPKKNAHVKQAKKLCKKINNDINKKGDLTYTTFTEEEESEGMWYVWEIHYPSRGVKEAAYFAFMKIKGKYVLADLDY